MQERVELAEKKAELAAKMAHIEKAESNLADRTSELVQVYAAVIHI
jgi:hypothetical protein